MSVSASSGTSSDTGNRNKLEVGVLLPTGEGLMAGQSPHWSDIVEMARVAEAVGLHSVWVPDHLLMRFEQNQRFSRPRGTWECWTLLAALAASTSRVQLGTLVSTTTFRNPAILARMIDTLEDISGGRVIAGLGAGDAPFEHQAFGVPYDHRASRFSEAIEIISSLLRTGQSTFQGKYYQTDECELRPRGPRPSGPPIMIGARPGSPRMMGLMARYADLWNSWLVFGRNNPDQVPPLREAVDAACREIGRDPSTLGRTLSVQVDFVDRGDRPPHPNLIHGSAEQIAETFRVFVAEGICQLQVVPRPTTPETIERLGQVLEYL